MLQTTIRYRNCESELMLLAFAWLGALVPCSQCWATDESGLQAERLRCEYRVNPLGIGEQRPRLSWVVTSDQRDQRQTAYHLLVASSPELLTEGIGDLWDSGLVHSDQTTHVEYAGKPLSSRQRCFWRVRVWDRDHHPGAWSDAATWSMGLLQQSDWLARYITFRDDTPVFTDKEKLFLPAARQYRRSFEVDATVRKATLYATALGIYELYLNGQRVGDVWFAPGWTDYRRRAYYNTHDVTDLLQQGENAIGVWLADGWYSGYVGFGLLTGIGVEQIGRYTYGKTPAVMAQLEIELEDGTVLELGTDTSWQVTDEGPIREADLLMGERYDARRELLGWSTAGSDDSDWQAAIFAEQAPPAPATFYEYVNPSDSGAAPAIKARPVDLAFHRPRLEAFPGEPVRVIEEVKPVQITKRGQGTYVFDMGQNFAGVVRLKLSGPAGHEVKLRYGEMLHPDGRLMTENLRKARAVDYYICSGDPNGETYTPRFTFHGFQYVEVSNLRERPTDETLTGLVLHSDTPLVSQFECSDSMVNQLFKNIVWTQRANFLDLPTDCPQRDERMGWTGDAQIYVGAATYNADVGAFFTKWLRELMESQRPSGVFPGYAPYPFQHGWDFGTAWCDAGVICPWTIWQAYNDTRVIDRCWKPMTRFMDWRRRTSRDDLGVSHGNNWGDWLAQGETTPLDYIDTIYLAISARMMGEMAEATGRTDEAADYRDLFERVKVAFDDRYVSPNGTLTIETQTAYALALQSELIPKSLREQMGQRLAKRIQNNGTRMATGFLGTRPLLPVLSQSGQHDLATFLLQSHEFPSWGYEVDQGATTIWERWDSYTKEDGFDRHNAEMNSFAHYSFGAVCEWMFGYLAGIQSDGPGYKRIIIRPMPPAPGSNGDHRPIDWVRASYDSIHGRIVSAWHVNDDRFELEVEIPANTTATVYIPTEDARTVTVNQEPIDEVKEITLLSKEAARVALRCGSGRYVIVSKHGMPAADRPYSASSTDEIAAAP